MSLNWEGSVAGVDPLCCCYVQLHITLSCYGKRWTEYRFFCLDGLEKNCWKTRI